MAGAGQVGRASLRVDRNQDGSGAVVSGNSGGHPEASVNGLAKGGAVIRGVFRAHGPDAQMVEPLLRERQANQPAPMLGHEVDGLGRDFLGGQHQVAFVLAVFVIDNNDHSPGANFFDRGRNVGKWRVRAHQKRLYQFDSSSTRAVFYMSNSGESSNRGWRVHIYVRSLEAIMRLMISRGASKRFSLCLLLSIVLVSGMEGQNSADFAGDWVLKIGSRTFLILSLVQASESTGPLAGSLARLQHLSSSNDES